MQIRTGVNLIAGFNEFYVKASPPMSESHLDHGLRVRLLENGSALVDRTLWAEGGAVVAGTVSLTLGSEKGGSHDH